MVALVKQSTTQLALKFFMTDSADHITGKTGLTCTVTIRKEGGSFASPGGAVTEIANGWYQVAANATDTNTLGEILLHATATGADPCDLIAAQVVAFDPTDAAALGLSRIDAAITTRMATFTLPTNFSALAITAGGAVTVGTNNDKSGYSLTQTFPANFSSLAITAGGATTVGTNNDKTGYSLTQAFPANFSALSINGSGFVSITGNIKKNTALNGFTFVMSDSTTHAPKTGLTITSQRTIDGGALASTTNSATEISNGLYTINLSAADLNGNIVTLRFSATGADDLNETIITAQ